MKKLLVYNLTGRGFFSEILNLALAKLYADYYQWDFCVNTRNWNARIEEGWLDYFQPTIPCTNELCTSQIFVSGRKTKLKLHDIYCSPKRVLLHYCLSFVNRCYNVFSPGVVLNDIVWEEMRSDSFISCFPPEILFGNYCDVLSKLLIYNKNTIDKILYLKRELNIPSHYIGVHIRRGDKIETKEMQSIPLSFYLEAIMAQKNVSTNVYIATDDVSIISYMQKELKKNDFNVFFNFLQKENGFNEKNFNRKSADNRYQDIIYTLLDFDILIHSNYFIGTYSSNLSRVVPCFISKDKTQSLDIDWEIVF